MLSNSQVIFDQLAEALYRAAFYISFADDTDGAKSRKAELQALHVVMQVLQRDHDEDHFLRDLGKLAAGDLVNTSNLELLSDADIQNIRNDLASVPDEVYAAAQIALENFSKDEARLYTDMVLSAAASIAQAYDEKDDFVFQDGAPDIAYIIANMGGLFARLLSLFNRVHEDKNAKYLYDQSDIFDEMKISAAESDALGRLSLSIRSAWGEKYPEDLQQTVQDIL